MMYDHAILDRLQTVTGGLAKKQTLVVLLLPVERPHLETLLSRFPDCYFVVTPAEVTSRRLTGVRVAYRYGEYFANWKIPDGSYETAVIVGPRAQVGLRGLRTAFKHGVRKLMFLSGDGRTVFVQPIYECALELVRSRVKKSIRARSSAKNIPIRRLAKKIPVPRLAACVVARWDEHSFVRSLRDLCSFADREGPESERKNRVALAIGTMGAGGSERQVVNTAVSLAKQGTYEPVIMCSNLGGTASRFYQCALESAGVRVLDLKQLKAMCIAAEHRAFFAACCEKLRRLPFDIQNDTERFLMAMLGERPAVVHSFLDDTNIKAGLAALLSGVPRVILSFRSMAPYNFRLHMPFMRPGYRALVERPEVKFTSNSEAGAADYKKWIGSSRLAISVVRNGVDLEKFVAQAETRTTEQGRFGIPRGSLVVGSVMRLTEEKGPILWAKVALEISRQRSDVHFVLAGDGALKNEVLEIVSNRPISKRVHMLGSAEDIPTLLRCFDLFLLTSRLEGLPNVLIEAQAAGVPVVTTPAGGAVEALDAGHTGLIASDHSAESVAATCLQLLNNAEMRRRMSRAASDFTRRTFSLERMLQETLRLYTE